MGGHTLAPKGVVTVAVWRTLAGGVMALVVLALLAGHSLGLPLIKVDQTTIGLLIMLAVAALLPDLTRIAAPGGWEANFQRSLSEAEKELGRIRGGTARVRVTATTMTPGTDPGVRLAELRIGVERALRELAGAQPTQPLGAVIEALVRDRKISGGLRRSLDAFLRATDAYLGERRSRASPHMARALTVGEEVLERLTGQFGRV